MNKVQAERYNATVPDVIAAITATLHQDSRSLEAVLNDLQDPEVFTRLTLAAATTFAHHFCQMLGHDLNGTSRFVAEILADTTDFFIQQHE